MLIQLSTYSCTLYSPGKKVYIRIKQNKKPVENMDYFPHVETNQSCMHEEINAELNSVNACHQSVPNLLPTCFVF
jgi:hypothetical protein